MYQAAAKQMVMKTEMIQDGKWDLQTRFKTQTEFSSILILILQLKSKFKMLRRDNFEFRSHFRAALVNTEKMSLICLI